MVARQLAGRRPLYFTDIIFLSSYFIFYSLPNLGDLWADRPQTLPLCSELTVIYKVESEICGSVPKQIWRPKNIKTLATFRLRDLIANICGREQDIVDGRSENGVGNCDHSGTPV